MNLLNRKNIKSTTFKIEKSVFKIKLEAKYIKNHYSLRNMNFSILDVNKTVSKMFIRKIKICL